MGSGGGGSETTTVDPVYNAGMLQLSQEQQGWAREMFNMFKYGVTYDPSEKIQVDDQGNMIDTKAAATGTTGGLRQPQPDRGDPRSGDFVLPTVKYDKNGNLVDTSVNRTTTSQGLGLGKSRGTTMTRGEYEGYNPDETTSEMEYLQNLVDANQSLLGLQTGAQKKRLDLYGTYVDDINKGIDVNSRMNEAQASVQHGFKNANRAARMDIASYGLDPAAGRYAGINRENTMAEASTVAGARTAAKNYAEAEDFQRKTEGLQIQ